MPDDEKMAEVHGKPGNGTGGDKDKKRWECAWEEREGTGKSGGMPNGVHVVEGKHMRF